jgi:putative NADH-flavin reductase
MKLTVIAATGRTGSIIVAEALEAGHDVTAVARHPDRIAPRVRAVRVDLNVGDAADLEPAVDGADAVLSALGPRSNAEVGIASRGTRAIIKAMEASGARRLIVVSAAPVGTVPSPSRPDPPRHDPGDGLLISRVLTPVVKAALRRQYADLAVMEDAVRASQLDWTIVRPPRLVNKPASGKYRVAIGQNVRHGRRISRAALALVMLALVDQPDTVRQTVGVAD